LTVTVATPGAAAVAGTITTISYPVIN
jgi:hypothetical protein